MRTRVVLLFVLSVILRCPASDHEWPGSDWPTASAAEAGLDASKLDQARKYALSAEGSGLIIRKGRAVMRWGDQGKLYDIKSATKSIGSLALGIAIKDGKIDLHTPASQYHPSLGVPPESNRETGWLDQITILHLATHTAGFVKPGGFEKLAFEPGSKWGYSDGAPNWLAECITLQYGRDIEELLFDRVFSRLGIERRDLRWRQNQYRPKEIDGIARREFGAGVHANVNALARIGLLYLHEGRWKGEQILSSEYVRRSTRPIQSIKGLPVVDAGHGKAPDHYGLLWWNNGDGSLAKVPRDAYWAWGLHDSIILVIPSLDLVAARGGERGKSWRREKGSDHYDVLKPFFEPIAAAIIEDGARIEPPYAESKVISRIEWAPPESIVRKAKGSDNWPLTSGDDGALYTAYGDGWGFEPRVEKKLSMGFSKVIGEPQDFRGINIRSDAEQLGDGREGRKASGMLMVDGILYLLARNAGNSQLAWSTDRGKSLTWADWKFTTSFGCPTFLNFGPNYTGARDTYVYCYSHDSDSAYKPADTMVMARVRKDRVKEGGAYEFFAGFDANKNPLWTREVENREAVFTHPSNCYRSGITYNAALKRYLWVQILPHSKDSRGPRFQGGLGVYDAPEPWGPWTTAYFTREWDVGPGETASFPTQWMSEDGRTLHLAFSGDDYFSVRKATLLLE